MNTSSKVSVPDSFIHRQVTVEGVSIHVITAGLADKPAVFFLHGFPEKMINAA